MNVMPAKVAGVPEVVMAVPTPAGERNPLVLAAAALCGVDRVFTIGGAQAVGALAYGTKLVPAVDKIVGPGNAYVAAAKRRVFGVVGIDMIAGPSEIIALLRALEERRERLVAAEARLVLGELGVNLGGLERHAFGLGLLRDELFLDELADEVLLEARLERGRDLAAGALEAGARALHLLLEHAALESPRR